MNNGNVWDIQRLFVHFNNHADGYIQVDEKNEFTLHKGKLWGTLEQREASALKVNQLIKDWTLFSELNLDDEYISHSTGSESKAISIDSIRTLYRDVIKKQFEKRGDKFASAAIGQKDGDRVIIQDVDDKDIRNLFHTSLVAQWGEGRITKILARHKIDLQQSKNPLLVKDVRRIYASLVQLKENDLREAYESYKLFRNEEKPAIPTFLHTKFAAHKDKLEQVFKDLPEDFNLLSPEQTTALVQAISFSRDEMELCLLGSRIEGVIVGHRLWDVYRYFHSNLYEDSEIIQVYQEILQSNPGRYTDVYYAELWSKLLVKKEGDFVEGDLEGRLIPGPNNEWYKIAKVTNKWGKCTIFLESLSDPSKLLIQQCSTAFSWSSSKNLSSLLQDTNPFAPPGYLSGTDFSEEIKFLSNPKYKHVQVIGHSLGGSYAQLTLFKYMETLKEAVTDKKVDLIVFDSPSIKASDAKFVADNQDLLDFSVSHFFHYGDVVPFSGSSEGFVGVGCPEKMKAYYITSEDKNTPEFNISPHCNYLFRFIDRLNNHLVDGVDELTEEQLRAFGTHHDPLFRAGRLNNNPLKIDFKKYVVEPVRRVGGFFISAILYVPVWIQEHYKEHHGFDIKQMIADIFRAIFWRSVPTSNGFVA